MALKIRLARGGAKKRPFYRIVVAEATAPRDGRFIERIVLDEARAKHWLFVGAQPTDRVLRFLDERGLMKRSPKNNPEKAKPGKKAVERAEEKRKKAEEAAA